MTKQYVWIVSITNDDSETWVSHVCDSEATALHAVTQVKQQFIYDGICGSEAEVDKYYFIEVWRSPIEAFADVEIATPLDDPDYDDNGNLKPGVDH